MLDVTPCSPGPTPSSRKGQLLPHIHYTSEEASNDNSLSKVLLLLPSDSIKNIIIRSSREIEDFVETHVCKLCVILRSRVLLSVSSIRI